MTAPTLGTHTWLVDQHGKPRLALSLEDAAVATGYSLATIRRAIDRGDLMKRHANAKPVVVVDDLWAWLEALPTDSPAA